MLKRFIIVLLTIVSLYIPSMCYGQQAIANESAAEYKKDNTLRDKDSLEFDSLTMLLEEVNEKAKEGSVTVAAGFRGDEAGKKTTSILNTNVEIKKWGYPTELRFNVESNIRFEDGSITDDVTTLLLNYDYYVKPNVEVYGFIERFKDNFLAIQQRYEIGIGFKLETGILGFVCKAEEAKAATIERLYHMMSEDLREPLHEDKAAALASIKRRDSRLLLSIAFSFFQELEKPDDINAMVDSRDTTIMLSSKTRYRIVVRPCFIYRFTNDLSLMGLCYLKAPAFKPQRIDDRYDLRVDAVLLAGLKLAGDKRGGDKVLLNFSYDAKYDNAPPSAVIGGERFAAEKFHGITKFKISVKF